jgi:bisanhydrobacterioruberin hydratase
MFKISQQHKFFIATFIALLFHVSGCIGMFTSHKDWFIRNTPLNLLLMFVLLLWTQQEKNRSFYFFLLTCFVVGILVEIVGVNTSVLFGRYEYGSVMGKKIMNVPWLIGINWFVIMYTSGMAVSQVHHWVEKQYATAGAFLSPQIRNASIIIDGALLATFFDYIMEPVAIKLEYWSWFNGNIPFFNYLCWFIVSLVLLYVFTKFNFNRHNQFAVHLLIIQLLFFGVLRTFL